MRHHATCLLILATLAGLTGCQSSSRRDDNGRAADYRQEQAERVTERDVQRAAPPPQQRRQPMDARDQRRQNVIDQPR